VVVTWRQVLVVGILQAQKTRLQNDKVKKKGEETTPRTDQKVVHYKSEQMERRDHGRACATLLV
jgi:hypothetical protein